jgi:hypothetical protein
MHGLADALIGAATADIGHRFIDVLVRRLGVFLEQRGSRHDLAGLAIAALGHIDLSPGLLHRVRGIRRQALDGDDDVGFLDVAERDLAGARHLAVEMNRAGAALGDAAAIFGAGQADMFANDPQQGRVGLRRYFPHRSVDVEFCHMLPPSGGRSIAAGQSLAYRVRARDL